MQSIVGPVFASAVWTNKINNNNNKKNNKKKTNKKTKLFL